MYAVLQALAGSAFTDVMGVPTRKSLPSWYLVATEDQAISRRPTNDGRGDAQAP
jgi:hypothetical protein